MKKATRILALVLCAVMCLGLFVGCGNKGKRHPVGRGLFPVQQQILSLLLRDRL